MTAEKLLPRPVGMWARASLGHSHPRHTCNGIGDLQPASKKCLAWLVLGDPSCRGDLATPAVHICRD